MDSDLRLRNFLTIAFIITGTASLFTSKMQNIQLVEEAGKQKRFFHPYMQTLCMFIGEFCCLIIFLILRARNKKAFLDRAIEAENAGKKKLQKGYVLIPTACDLVASTMSYIALNFIPASVYQMLKGGGLITTAIFSYLLLKKKIKRNHISGCILALVGVTIVGGANLYFSDSSSFQEQTGLQILGYILMVLSLTFNGFFYSYEQKLFSTYHIEPVQMVGIEGLFGILLCLVMIPIVTFIPCPFRDESCVFAGTGEKFIERPEEFFRQVGSNTMLAVMVPLGILAVGSFNINGLSITKYINALARSLLNMTKTVVIWLIGIIVTIYVGETDARYRWENTKPWAIVVQAIGFSFLVFATLIYNQNIKIKYLSEPAVVEEERKSLMSSGGV